MQTEIAAAIRIAAIMAANAGKVGLSKPREEFTTFGAATRFASKRIDTGPPYFLTERAEASISKP